MCWHKNWQEYKCQTENENEKKNFPNFIIVSLNQNNSICLSIWIMVSFLASSMHIWLVKWFCVVGIFSSFFFAVLHPLNQSAIPFNHFNLHKSEMYANSVGDWTANGAYNTVICPLLSIRIAHNDATECFFGPCFNMFVIIMAGVKGVYSRNCVIFRWVWTAF